MRIFLMLLFIVSTTKIAWADLPRTQEGKVSHNGMPLYLRRVLPNGDPMEGQGRQRKCDFAQDARDDGSRRLTFYTEGETFFSSEGGLDILVSEADYKKIFESKEATAPITSLNTTNTIGKSVSSKNEGDHKIVLIKDNRGTSIEVTVTENKIKSYKVMDTESESWEPYTEVCDLN